MLSVAFLVKNPPIDRMSVLVDYLREVADEFIIVDTGSDEQTLLTMQSWKGATVIRAPWEDDFSKARNIGLSACTRKWTLVVDPDELPSWKMLAHLKSVDESDDGSTIGYVYFTRNYWSGALGEEINSDWHIRLFRTGQGRFYRRVHELVELDGKPEHETRGSHLCVVAPKEAYLIHSKPPENMARDCELYTRIEQMR